ncbi:MAG TPA: cupredoxin domain-containing protein [Acidimicrobiales bacterium]|nr:cupredoxin domain-containing protein [Acidimicrobiales bacterium]
MARRSRAILGGVAVAAALALSSCSGGGGGTPGAATSSSGTHIVIHNFMFSPMSLTVAPSSTVSVTNEDGVTHTLTAVGGQFDTGDIAPHRTKVFHAPSRPGTYHYICSIHQYMMGSIVVR